MGKKKGYDISEAELKTELGHNRETISFTSQDYDAILNRKISDAIEEEDALASTETKENDGGIKRVSLVIVVGKADNEDNQEQSTPSMDAAEPELIEDTDYENIQDDHKRQREETQVSSNEPVREEPGCQIESVLDENGDSLFPQETLDDQTPVEDSQFETTGVLDKEENKIIEISDNDEKKESVSESKPTDSRRSTFKNQQFTSIDLSENEKVEVKVPEKKKAITMGKCKMRALCFASVAFLIFLIIIVVCVLATGHHDDDHRLARKANLPHFAPDSVSQSPENTDVARKPHHYGFEPATNFENSTRTSDGFAVFHSPSTFSEERETPTTPEADKIFEGEELEGSGDVLSDHDLEGDYEDDHGTNSTIYNFITEGKRENLNEKIDNEINEGSTLP